MLYCTWNEVRIASDTYLWITDVVADKATFAELITEKQGCTRIQIRGYTRYVTTEWFHKHFKRVIKLI